MIRSAKRKEKIRTMWHQGYGEKNICAMEGITSAELRAILEEPTVSNEAPPALVLTDLQIRVLKVLSIINTHRSAAVLSGQMAVPIKTLQVALDSLEELQLITSSNGPWTQRKWAAYTITPEGMHLVQQWQVSA